MMINGIVVGSTHSVTLKFYRTIKDSITRNNLIFRCELFSCNLQEEALDFKRRNPRGKCCPAIVRLDKLIAVAHHASKFVTSFYIIYNIYTWFVGSKHSHWLMVVRTILLWQITECSLVGRWSFSVRISELWRFA
jgi:hypothetical protein